MKKIEIKEGQKFNRLTVVAELDKVYLPSGQSNRMIYCKCDCGTYTRVRLLHLVRNRIISCGCAMGEYHGEVETPLYRVWRGIKNRVRENYFQRSVYFDKGITMCKEWADSYVKFRNWANNNGYEFGLQIDRRENSKGYSPENCRFVTSFVNMNNRDNTTMVVYNGEKIPFTTLVRQKGLFNHSGVIRTRLKRGWRVEKAIDTPIRKGNYYKEKAQELAKVKGIKI